MTEGWITRRKLFSTCFQLLDSSLGVARVWEQLFEQQVVLRVAVAVDATSLCANWPADMHSSLSPTIAQSGHSLSCGNLPSLAHSYFASSRILPSYANHIGCQLDDIWDWEYASLHTTFHFWQGLWVSRQLPELLSATLPNNFSDVAKFCLTITEDALKFSPSIMPNRLFARQPDCMIAANRHCKIKL